MTGLTLKQVGKNFGELSVIRDVSLTIESGELVVFVGPSGCGKSTLLRMIAGLEDISSGEFWIGDRRADRLPAAAREIAMVFQSYALYPHMTLGENIAFPLKLAKRPGPFIEQKVQEIAAVLRLENLLDRKPGQISGGQRQRVAIGRALARGPEVILLDEPLSNLDAALRLEMRVELARLHKHLGATMIYVTHDQVEAMTLADRIVIMRDGQVEQVGSPLDLYTKPANTFVAEFIGSPKMNLFTVDVDNASSPGPIARLADGLAVSVPDGCGNKVLAGIRPEHLRPVSEGGLRGEVVAVEHLGADTFVYFDTGMLSNAVARLSGIAPVRVGDTIGFGFEAAQCNLFHENGMSLAG